MSWCAPGCPDCKRSFVFLCLCLVTQLCPTLCDPMNCSPPGCSAHGTLQIRILGWVAMPSSRRSSQPRDWTQISCIAGGFCTIWATMETCVSRQRQTHSWFECLTPYSPFHQTPAMGLSKKELYADMQTVQVTFVIRKMKTKAKLCSGRHPGEGSEMAWSRRWWPLFHGSPHFMDWLPYVRLSWPPPIMDWSGAPSICIRTANPPSILWSGTFLGCSDRG